MAKIKYGIWNATQEAVKEFTDREDPQEAFERKFRVLSESWKDSYYVLCYYGIGGIGKTSFVNKLCRVIRGVEGNNLRLLNKIDCHYVRYDFEAKDAGKDKLSILLSLRKQLGEENKNFQFFRFDSTILLYAKKSGRSIEKDENAQSLLEKNPWLDTVVSTVGAIPVASWVADVLQVIDKSAKTIKETLSKYMDKAQYRQHLNEIDGMELSELLDKLHEYFILDMRYNMQRVSTKPLIVFLDSYEKFVDSMNQGTGVSIEDYWLRNGYRSVIRSIPGLLWVITGREKLYWTEDDEWEVVQAERPFDQMSEAEKEELAKSDLEQHLLGDLSFKDADCFLKKAGIDNDTLCKQLYKLTNGTPLFLDICADTYHELRDRGIWPECEQFGENRTQLISRYLSNMNEANRELAYFLACLGTWNDENVKRIANEARTLRGYTYSKYEYFLKNSFIIKNSDGSYYMHKTVREAVIENADKEMLEEISRIKFSEVEKMVETDEMLNSNTIFEEWVRMLTENIIPYEEFYKKLAIAKKKLRYLKSVGAYDVACRTAKQLYFIAKDNYGGTGAEYIAQSEYGDALRKKGKIVEATQIVCSIPDSDTYDMDELDKCTIDHLIANIYRENEMYNESLELKKKVWEKRTQLLGEKDPNTIRTMASLASAYYVVGEKQKAFEMRENVYELERASWGDNHPKTLKSMQDLAISYNDMGEKKKALEMLEKVYELSIDSYGEKHPDTLMFMYNLASVYEDIGEKQKSLEMLEEVYELRKEVLGEGHPDTIRTMEGIASACYEVGEKQKALEMQKKVCEFRKELLGEAHKKTIKAMQNLAVFYRDMGENVPDSL